MSEQKDEQKRCPCGARIVSLTEIKTSRDHKFVYTCGVCGTQLEVLDSPY